MLMAGQEDQISLKRIQGDKELNQILRVIRYYREETTKLHGSFLYLEHQTQGCVLSGGRG